jgi:hypothetical protein
MSTPDGDRTFQAKYAIGGAETEQEVLDRTTSNPLSLFQSLSNPPPNRQENMALPPYFPALSLDRSM